MNKENKRTINSKNAIIGLAVADALGVPIEFSSREQLANNNVTEMTEYGTYDVQKGSWSDDTSMTLCLIDAINKTGEILPKDIMDNFVKWVKFKEYTPAGVLFDIGGTCLEAIRNYYEYDESPLNCGLDSEDKNGNGSLMRISPIIYYAYSKNLKEDEIYKIVKDVSSLTHRHSISIMACYIYVLYGIELLKGKSIKEAYDIIKSKDYSMFDDNTRTKYNRILNINISLLDIYEINSTGYVVDTLEATFWTLLTTDSYDNAIIKAVNLGNDTDTIGACTGALAGLYYGIDSINESWKKELLRIDYIIDLCDEFDRILNKVQNK